LWNWVPVILTKINSKSFLTSHQLPATPICFNSYQ
jgi:hypothetical protein